MTPSEAAGRAMHLIDHPYMDPSGWDLLSEEVRAWWIDRAQPITDAVQGAAA